MAFLSWVIKFGFEFNPNSSRGWCAVTFTRTKRSTQSEHKRTSVLVKIRWFVRVRVKFDVMNDTLLRCSSSFISIVYILYIYTQVSIVSFCSSKKKKGKPEKRYFNFSRVTLEKLWKRARRGVGKLNCIRRYTINPCLRARIPIEIQMLYVIVQCVQLNFKQKIDFK